MSKVMPYLFVSIGAIFGANLRYITTKIIGAHTGTDFPLATFVVNVSGCFLIGFASYVLSYIKPEFSTNLRLLVSVGFLGAFTTFSSFELETHNLLKEGAFFKSFLYVILSLIVGFVALRVGELVSKYLINNIN